MSWDNDKSGHYVPPNPPWWVWLGIAGILFSPVILYLLFG